MDPKGNPVGSRPGFRPDARLRPIQTVEPTTLNKGIRLAGDGTYTGEKDPSSIPLGPCGRPVGPSKVRS